MINLALNCLTTNNHTICRILYLTAMAHLSTVTNSWRTTRSLIQTLVLIQFLTPSVELATPCLLPLLGMTLLWPETSYTTQIINQISTAVIPPLHIDIPTLILLANTVGTTYLVGPALKATTLFSPRERRSLLFTAVMASLLTPVTAIPTALDTALLTRAACLLSNFWLSNRGSADDEHAESPLGPLSDNSILGSATLRPGLHVLHVNIRGGISTFTKWRSVIEILNAKNPDILVLTETGHDNKPSTLKWLTREMRANELNSSEDRSKLADSFKDTLPYNIYSTNGTTGEGRGGVAVLVHTSLSHRIIRKPSFPAHKRWMTITIATPDEHIKLIATYMRPSPQSCPQARAEWTELTDYAVNLGIKNNTVLIVGDLNASMNTPHTRRFPSQSKRLQERLLSSLLNAGKLVDAFPTLHPDSHYCSWWSKETWSSPDHFLISEHQAHRLRSAQIDLSTPRRYNLDHGIFSVVLDVTESLRPPPPTGLYASNLSNP